MSQNPPSTDWSGFALDALIILSMTVLTALRVAEITVFVAVVGPIVGARLAAMRFLRGGGGGPPDHGAGGSAVVVLLVALAALFRRPTLA